MMVIRKPKIKVVLDHTCVIHQVMISNIKLTKGLFNQILCEEIFGETRNELNGQPLGFINCWNEDIISATNPCAKMILWLTKKGEMRLCRVDIGYYRSGESYLNHSDCDKKHLNELHDNSFKIINELPQIFLAD